MLGQRLRRWPNIKTALFQCLVFAGLCHLIQFDSGIDLVILSEDSRGHGRGDKGGGQITRSAEWTASQKTNSQGSSSSSLCKLLLFCLFYQGEWKSSSKSMWLFLRYFSHWNVWKKMKWKTNGSKYAENMRFSRIWQSTGFRLHNSTWLYIHNVKTNHV